MARILGWLVALAMAPLIIQAFRRGWSRPRDLARFYILLGALVWGLAIAYHQAFRFPSFGLLVDTLAATVLYWFAFQRPDVRSSWLEPGANRLPSRTERRLIRWMPVMAPALAVEAGVVVLFGTWLRRFVGVLYPVSLTLFLLTLGLCVIAARGWKEAGRLL